MFYSVLLAGIIHSEADSLFTYREEGFSTFYDPDYTPMFEATFNNSDLEAIAVEICGDDQFCLYDIAATEDINIGLTTLIGGVMFEEIVNISTPSRFL